MTSTCSFAAGPKPVPLSFSSVTVNVCGWPISFVAFGAIEIRAATQTFVAGPEFVAAAVRRSGSSETPPTEVVTSR